MTIGSVNVASHLMLSKFEDTHLIFLQRSYFKITLAFWPDKNVRRFLPTLSNFADILLDTEFFNAQ